MNDPAPDAARRGLLAALAALPFAPAAALAAGPAFPEDCTLLVAGPEDGLTARRGRLIASALQPDAATPLLHLAAIGGVDGVTAANQFVTRVARDGAMALLVPGTTALAWLAGEPRAQFDAGAWLAVLAGVTPGLLACRLPRTALRPGQRLRIAAGGPGGPELPALMAAELLGLTVEPVYGLAERDAAAAALAGGAVDAVYVGGPGGLAHAAMLAAAGAPPAFALGLPDGRGVWRRDPALPEVPTVAELIDVRSPSLPKLAAWQAVALATQLEFALVLPPLTPAAQLAQWRHAGEAPAVGQALRAAEPDLRPITGAEAQAALASLRLDAPALLGLRQWLVTTTR